MTMPESGRYQRTEPPKPRVPRELRKDFIATLLNRIEREAKERARAARNQGK
jgi:hypothetical protein